MLQSHARTCLPCVILWNIWVTLFKVIGGAEEGRETYLLTVEIIPGQLQGLREEKRQEVDADWGGCSEMPHTMKMWPASEQFSWRAITLLPVAGLLFPSSLNSCKHPVLPVKTFVIHVGFLHRSPLKSWCAAQLKGKRLHTTHSSSGTAHTPCQVKRQNTRITSGSWSYTWQQKVSPFHSKIAFPVTSPWQMPRQTSKFSFRSFPFKKKKVPFPGGRKLQTAVWFAVCMFLKLNEKCSGWIQSNNM